MNRLKYEIMTFFFLHGTRTPAFFLRLILAPKRGYSYQLLKYILDCSKRGTIRPVAKNKKGCKSLIYILLTCPEQESNLHIVANTRF